jgi:hypothetical protein
MLWAFRPTFSATPSGKPTLLHVKFKDGSITCDDPEIIVENGQRWANED